MNISYIDNKLANINLLIILNPLISYLIYLVYRNEFLFILVVLVKEYIIYINKLAIKKEINYNYGASADTEIYNYLKHNSTSFKIFRFLQTALFILSYCILLLIVFAALFFLAIQNIIIVGFLIFYLIFY